MKNNPTYPVRVVCLEREAKRRVAMEKQLANLGIEATYSGIDAQAIPDDILSRYNAAAAQEKFGRQLTLEELACYASHFHIWREISEQALPGAVVLESDAGLSADFLETLLEIQKYTEEWDVVKLYWSECRPSFWRRRQLNGAYQLVKPTHKSYGTVGYMVNRKGACLLGEYSAEISYPVDIFLSGGKVKKPLSLYSVYPRLVSHLDDERQDSLIEERRRLLFGRHLRQSAPTQNALPLEQRIRHFFRKMAPPPDL